RYLASAWHGAHHECLDFADRAAQDAPPDSLIQALPLRAAYGYLTDGCGPEVPRARLDAAADRAVPLSARLPADLPWAAGPRTLLADVRGRLERRPAALEQLRRAGPYAPSVPWDRDAEDPPGRYRQARPAAREAVVSGAPSHLHERRGSRLGQPRSEQGGRLGHGDH